MFEEAVVSLRRFVFGGGVRVSWGSTHVSLLLPIDPGSTVTIDFKVGQTQNVIV